MNAELTKNEKNMINHIASLKVISWGVTAFGLFGVLLGSYASYFREMTSDARPLNSTLILNSIGIFFLGGLLLRLCTIVKKLAGSRASGDRE